MEKGLNNWRYELLPNPTGGTDVTESFRLKDTLPLKIYWALREMWARDAPAEVPSRDPDLLWDIVEARTRLPDR